MVNRDDLLFELLRKSLTGLMPATWKWRLRAAPPGSDADGVLELTDPLGGRSRHSVEVRSSLAPADIARQVPWYRQRGDWLIAAPRIGPRSRDLLNEAGLGWIELETGDCRIAAAGLYIDRVQGRARSTIRGSFTTDAVIVAADERRYVADLFSGKALKIVRWLLIDPSRTWSLKDMANAAGASLGFVSRTFATLDREAYLTREPGATRLRDRDALLETWVSARAPTEQRLERTMLVSTPTQVLEAIRGSGTSAPSYALTAEAAAEQIAPFARLSRIELYTLDPGDWDRDLGLTPVPRGGNVILIEPADPSILDGSETINGLTVVSRPQLYVDLKRRGGAASDAAAFLRERGALWPL